MIKPMVMSSHFVRQRHKLYYSVGRCLGPGADCAALGEAFKEEGYCILTVEHLHLSDEVDNSILILRLEYLVVVP